MNNLQHFFRAIKWFFTGTLDSPKSDDTCPVCLGDGSDEGWKIAFPCKACGGSGKYIDNELTRMEVKISKRQLELNTDKSTGSRQTNS